MHCGLGENHSLPDKNPRDLSRVFLFLAMVQSVDSGQRGDVGGLRRSILNDARRGRIPTECKMAAVGVGQLGTRLLMLEGRWLLPQSKVLQGQIVSSRQSSSASARRM